MVVVGILFIDFCGMSAGTGVVAGGSSGSEGTGAVAGGNRVVEVDVGGTAEAGAAEKIAGAAGNAGGLKSAIRAAPPPPRVGECGLRGDGPEAGAARRIADAAGKAGGASRCIATPTGSMGCCCCIVGCPSTTEGPSP